jgi:hypothetical protein
MPATDPTAGPDPLKRPAVRERRAIRGFQTPIVREVAPVAHGAAAAAFGRQYAMDRH